MHLPRTELSTSTEIGSVQGSDRVDNEEGEPACSEMCDVSSTRSREEQRESAPRLGHHRACLNEKSSLMIGVVGPRVRNVVQHLFAVESVTFSDGEQTDWSEGTFRVDVQALSFASVHLDGELPGVSS